MTRAMPADDHRYCIGENRDTRVLSLYSTTSLSVPVFTNEVPVVFRGIRAIRVRRISENRSL